MNTIRETPSITPSLLFTEDEVKDVDWNAVFDNWGEDGNLIKKNKMKILITSGGCKVPIDDVRNISNFSSGRYGSELADAFTNKGHDVIFFHEKESKEPKYIYHKFSDDNNKIIGVNPTIIRYKDYYDYLNIKELIKKEQPNIIISAAAISDYIVENKAEGKISSDQDELVIRLKKGEKVIKSFRELAPNAFIIGFKLLVNPSKDQIQESVLKVAQYCDAVVYNDLIKLRAGDSIRYLYDHLGGGNRPFPTSESLVDEIIKISYNCGLKLS